MISSKRAFIFVSLLLLAIVGPMCGSGGGGGGGGGTTGGGATFSVLSNNPAQSATGVARTATIYVKVNGSVNPASLTASTVTVTGLAAIPNLSLVWNAITSQIEITPAAANPFDSGALHTVNLTAGIMTTGGATLVPKTFTFTTLSTGDTTRPSFGGITSITNPSTTQVLVSWTQGTDDTSAQANLLYEVFLALATNNQDFGTTIPVPNVTGAGSLLISGLTPNTTYFIKVRCKDQAGNQSLPAAPPEAEQFQKTFVSFSTNIYTPIVNNICTQCHAPGGVSQFMDLQTGGSSAARAKWVNIDSDKGAGPPQMCQANTLKRVLPGDPANSLVYLKISMTTPPCGVQMPEGMTPLSTAQQQLFFDWITEGALDN